MRWLPSVALAVSLVAAPGLGAPARPPQTWVVAVGIDDYVREAIPDLRFADADAHLLAQALQELGHVPAGNIFALTSDAVRDDETPRVTNIVFRLGWLRQHAGPEDTVVFYFAGHGMHLDGQSFLLTEEADSRSLDTLKASSLRAEELFGLLRAIPSGKVLAVLDACRNDPSGRGPTLSENLSQGFTLSGQNRQNATIFSCSVGEKSWEWAARQHGFFTYHFAEGLKAAAVQPDGRITLQSLTNHLARAVPESTRRLAGASQTPIYRYEGPGLDSWELARVAAPRQARLSPAEQSQLVADLDATRSRLNEALAQQKILQERLSLEETERKRLQATLTALEQRTAQLEVPAEGQALVAAREQALRQLTSPEVLRAEKEELQAQNAALQARIRLLEMKLNEVGYAQARSLDLRLDAEWRGLDQAAQSSPPGPVQDSYRVKALVREQSLWLERLPEAQQWIDARAGRFGSTAPELEAQIVIYQNAISVLRKRLRAAEWSAQEAQARAREAEARTSAEQARVTELQAENARLRAGLLAARQDSSSSLARLRELEDELRRRFPGRPFDSAWNRITRRARTSDIYVEPNTGPEAQGLPGQN